MWARFLGWNISVFAGPFGDLFFTPIGDLPDRGGAVGLKDPPLRGPMVCPRQSGHEHAVPDQLEFARHPIQFIRRSIGERGPVIFDHQLNGLTFVSELQLHIVDAWGNFLHLQYIETPLSRGLCRWREWGAAENAACHGEDYERALHSRMGIDWNAKPDLIEAGEQLSPILPRRKEGLHIAE
jgi:hypothetical protein